MSEIRLQQPLASGRSIAAMFPVPAQGEIIASNGAVALTGTVEREAAM
ncbi:hypothetical protein [Microvirga sp. M2]